MRKLALLALGGLFLAAVDLQPFQAGPSVTPKVEITLLDDTLEWPVALAFAPDGRLFIGEQAGAIKIYKNGAMNASPYATVSPIVASSEAGLLGLCLDPDFDTNGYLYVFVTRGGGVQQIVRYTSDGDTGTDPTVVVDNIPTAGYTHNGGGIGFGPDGYLYAVVGDNNYPPDAQVTASWRGKVLRFDASTTPASMPDSNPIAGSPVYSIGHRHPFRLTFRPGTGALYVSENGPDDYDEINVITPGANYGWPTVTGPNGSPTYTEPFFSLPTFAITDLLFYTGSSLPYAGDLFFAEYGSGRIRRAKMSASGEQIAEGPYDFITGISGPVDIAQGPDGAIYYCSYIFGGRLYRAQAAAPLTVTQVDPAPDVQLTDAPAMVTLTFSTPVDAVTATSLNFTLVRSGTDGVFDTPDDVIITPASISANGTTVTLDLTGADLPIDHYRIRVSGTDAAPAAHSGLLAHWNFDEGAGTMAADSSGNGLDGTINAVEWAPGMFGTALRFSSDEGRVDIGAGVVTPEWTAAMWVRRSDDFYYWTVQSLMDTYESSTNTSLRLVQAAGDDVGITEYSVIDYGSGYQAPFETWIHLAFTSDASNARLYVNGVLHSTAPRAFDLTVDTLGSAIATRTRSLQGVLDEVQIYDRALTVTEIASLAVPSGGLRGTALQLLDGDFSGTLPSGNGVEGGDFVSQFEIVAPVIPPDPPAPAPADDDDDDKCGLLGIEGPLLLAVILLVRRRRRI